LNDWNTGKIKYFTHPPETENKNTHVSAEVVTEFAKEFSFDKLDKMDQDDINELPALNPSETMVLESSGMVDSASHEADAEDMEDGEDSDEDDEAEGENVGQLSNRMTVAVPKARVKKGEELPKFKADNLTKLKKATKMREKKARKDLRRRDKVGAELADGLESAFGALGGAAAADKEEKYDFGKDFEM
jgi:nuclear GTP-binding protein